MTFTTDVADRAVVIGLDGATYDVLQPLMQLGVMPNLRQFMLDCAWADLHSVVPCVTPAAWSTFQTGADPLEHGVLDYRYFDHRLRAVMMNTTPRLRFPTIFDFLATAGAKVVSLGLPMTWPAPDTVDGLIVGGIDSPSAMAAMQPYPEFARRLATAGVELSIDSIWYRRPQSLEEVTDRVKHTVTSFRNQAVAARLADKMIDWRCMVVQFQAIDALQHRCWHLLEVDPSTGAAPHAWTTALQRAFRGLDQALADLFELAAQRSAAVLIVSDHGFGPFREKISIREVLRRRNLLAHASLQQRIQFRTLRNTWKARRWVRRFVKGGTNNSMRRPLGSLDSIDWRRTRAVALHGTMAGLIYLVTPDRFGRGAVATAAQTDQALIETMAAFREAAHPETNEPLFAQVIDVRRRLGRCPLDLCLPDVVAIPTPGFHTRVKADRRPKLVPADPDMAGSHRERGVLMVAGAGVAPGKRAPAQLRDVAPTLLAMLGIPGHEQMQGRALAEYWTTGRQAPMPRRQTRASTAQRHAMSASDQRLVEERLRQLGYID